MNVEFKLDFGIIANVLIIISLFLLGYLKMFPEFLITAYIAFVVLQISYMQYQVNREKLKLDLFNERYKVYEVTNDFLTSIIYQEEITSEMLKQFLIDTRKAKFLFKKDIMEYLNEIYEKAENHLMVIENETRLIEENEKLRHVNTVSYFIAQKGSCDKKFMKYLSLKDRIIH